MPGGAAGATGGEEGRRRAMLEGRYVDDKGEPLLYESEYPYAKHPYAEFKMMPIRMDLVMDQRRLPRLLVECANSNMPIEVRRIRIATGTGSESLNLSPGNRPTAMGMEPGMPLGAGGAPAGAGHRPIAAAGASQHESADK